MRRQGCVYGRAPWRLARLLIRLLTCAVVAGGARATEVYRWSDAEGGLHYGDRPVAGAQRLELNAPRWSWRVVDHVYDGDTLHLADGEKVRLIGVNTPEVAHRSRAGEPGGEEAKAFLRAWVEGRRVRLVPGVEERDDYRRLLAYVYDEAGEELNARLLREGWGHALVIPPNSERADRDFALEAQARAAGRGIWALPRYRVRDAAEAEGLRNTFQRLRGRVERLSRSRKYLWIEVSGGLRLYLPLEAEAAFAAAGREVAALKGREVVARGWVRRRSGHPVIRLDHPLQIEEPVSEQ